jgi:hypothetical protein
MGDLRRAETFALQSFVRAAMNQVGACFGLISLHHANGEMQNAAQGVPMSLGVHANADYINGNYTMARRAPFVVVYL